MARQPAEQERAELELELESGPEPPPVGGEPRPGAEAPAGGKDDDDDVELEAEAREEIDPDDEKAREFIEQVREESSQRLRNMGRVALGIYAAATAVLVLVRLWPLDELNGARWTSADGVAAITAMVTFAVFCLLSALCSGSTGGLRRLIIGKDGRFSTSLTQAALWTVALFYALLYLFLRVEVCGTKCAAGGTFTELDASYMFLLGGPFAAAAAARATVASKVSAGNLQRVPAEGASPKDIVTNDDGRADLVDTQFLLFNVLALGYFVIAFIGDPSKLPDLPDGLVALTSLGALTYATNKALTSNAPVITAVKRVQGAGPLRPGDMVDILGVNLVPPGAAAVEYLTLISVRFGAVTATLSPTRSIDPVTGDLSATRLRVTVPEGIAADSYGVTVVTAAGVESNAVQVEVVDDLPTLVAVVPTKLKPGKPAKIVGTFLSNRLVPGRPFVAFGGTRVRAQQQPKQSTGTIERYTVDVPGDLTGDSVEVTVITAAGDETEPLTVLL